MMKGLVQLFRNSFLPLLFVLMANIDLLLVWYRNGITGNVPWFNFLTRTILAFVLGILVNIITNIRRDFKRYREIAKYTAVCRTVNYYKRAFDYNESQIIKMVTKEFNDEYYQVLSMLQAAHRNIPAEELKAMLNKYYSLMDEPDNTPQSAV
jgi:hypothetical protein